MKKNLYLYILAGVSLFVFSAGSSYLVSGLIKNRGVGRGIPTANQPSPTSDRSKIDPNLPKNEVCPLNGTKFTKQERDIWETRRPLAVVVENHLDSRPTSGLSTADIVYEAVAEGGITRFMGVYYCAVSAINETISPVRSARIYFTQIVPEYDALYNHVGGAGNCDDPTVDPRAKALCFIRTNKIKDLDQFGLDFKACHRVTNRLDREVAYEHTMACYTDELYKVAAKRGWDNWDTKFVSWKFKTDPSTSSGQDASNIKFDFWPSATDYSVQWQYDLATNSYKRSNGEQLATDNNTGDQLTAKNVVVQLVKETGPVDEHKHMLYEVVGKGKMLLFQDGVALPGTWSKSSPTSRTKYVLDSGKEVQFNPGVIWVELVPSANQIVY